MIIIVFHYIEMIIERPIILARFILLKQDIQSQWGWLASIPAPARSRGNWYSKNVLRDFLTWVAILIGLCSSILPAHWINFGQKFAKLSWNWKMLTRWSQSKGLTGLTDCLSVWSVSQSVSIFSVGQCSKTETKIRRNRDRLQSASYSYCYLTEDPVRNTMALW